MVEEDWAIEVRTQVVDYVIYIVSTLELVVYMHYYENKVIGHWHRVIRRVAALHAQSAKAMDDRECVNMLAELLAFRRSASTFNSHNQHHGCETLKLVTVSHKPTDTSHTQS